MMFARSGRKMCQMWMNLELRFGGLREILNRKKFIVNIGGKDGQK